MPDKKQKMTTNESHPETRDGVSSVQEPNKENWKEKAEEFEGKWKRALADYQNLERQTKLAQVMYIKLATKDFVEQLVEPYDHLLRAAGHLQDKGLDMVLEQFRKVFESQGLQEIDPQGKVFDPSTMEAVDTKEGEEGKVLEVMSRGYTLSGIVVKHALVVVGK